MGILATLATHDPVAIEQDAPSATPASPLQIALDYIGRGYAPIPVPYRTKMAILGGWQNLRISGKTAAQYFNRASSNVGVVLGAASGDLADVDIDCVEALSIADRFLPDTDSVFGRYSKPRSHRLFVAPDARTRRFQDPLTGTTLIELRANGGAQTVFPGSIHEEGEPIEWHVDGKPVAIGAETLLSAVTRLAVASLVVRYLGKYPIEQPIESWPGLLNAHDPKLGDVARRWLGIDEAPVHAPVEAPDSVDPAPERSEQIEHRVEPASATPAGSVLSAAVRAGDRQRYARRALADEVGRVRAAMPGGQHNALFVASARMGELLGAGVIDEATVRMELTSAASGWPLHPKKGPWFPHQIERTVADGVKKGITKPRDLSRVGQNGAAAGPSTEATRSTGDKGWPEPDRRLVDDDRTPAPVLDDDALPVGWGNWAEAEASARGCPKDYCAAALIGFGSALIGNSRHVSATSDWSEPPHLWIAQIGGPSSGKSPSIKPFVEAIREIENALETAWAEGCAKHAALVAAAELEQESWQNNVREAVKKKTAPPDRPANAVAPPSPPRPRVMAMDATTEQLQRLLAGQPDGLLYVRDELAGWFGNHDRYGGHGGDRAFYLECWNGGAYVVDRVKDNGVPIRIDRASLAMLGGMQPDRLREVLEGADDGLIARFLFVYPEPAPIAPLIRDDPDAATRQEKLRGAAKRLKGLSMGTSLVGQPTPRLLKLDDDAFELFEEIRRVSMEKARASTGLAAGWHGKNPGRALRLALIFELLPWAASDRRDEQAIISADSMVRAGGYLEYAAAMLDRVIAGVAIDQAEKDAAAIARHILATHAEAPTEPLNERKLYQQRGWAGLRDGDRRAAAFSVLVQAGWIRPAETTGGGRPRGNWDVSPRLWEQNR